MNTLFARIMQVIGLAAVVSILLWAGFNIRWWVPMDEGPSSLREIGLVLIHLFSLFAGVLGLAWEFA